MLQFRSNKRPNIVILVKNRNCAQKSMVLSNRKNFKIQKSKFWTNNFQVSAINIGHIFIYKLPMIQSIFYFLYNFCIIFYIPLFLFSV